MQFESYGYIMKPWVSLCNDLKKRGELEGNSAMKAFGKILANACYGQTLKRD